MWADWEGLAGYFSEGSRWSQQIHNSLQCFIMPKGYRSRTPLNVHFVNAVAVDLSWQELKLKH